MVPTIAPKNKIISHRRFALEWRQKAMMNNKTISTQPESKVQRLKMPYCNMTAIKKLTGLIRYSIMQVP